MYQIQSIGNVKKVVFDDINIPLDIISKDTLNTSWVVCPKAMYQTDNNKVYNITKYIKFHNEEFKTLNDAIAFALMWYRTYLAAESIKLKSYGI